MANKTNDSDCDEDIISKVFQLEAFGYGLSCNYGAFHSVSTDPCIIQKNDKITHQYHIYDLRYESATESWPGHCIV